MTVWRVLRRLSGLAMLLGMAAMSFAGVEENRVQTALAEMPAVVARYQQLIDQAEQHSDPAALGALGTQLWQAATADVQSGHLDDRSLYWARLAIRAALIDRNTAAGGLDTFERASRGMTDLDFPSEDPPSQAVRRVLISGFDPFHLDTDIRQSNPSGLVALALDGRTLETADGPAHIEAVLFPVRFVDFDQGLVESFFDPLLATVELVLTISMGRDAFDLERFPGRRRSAAVPDNLNVRTGATGANPVLPLLRDAALEGPEFVEFSLPASRMRAVAGSWVVRDNRNVTTLEQGALVPESLGELAGLTAVAGSGGGYLSNEISYRSVLLSQQRGIALAIGHLHTPRVAGYDPEVEAQIVAQIERILLAALD